MRKIGCALLALSMIVSCKHRKNLQEQLKESFSNHLEKIDSTSTLDSIHILWNLTITDKVGRIINDSIYVREFTRVKGQLMSASRKQDRDSMEFLEYELNYMKKEIDSVTREIAGGDTSRRFGYLINCAYYLAKNDKKKTDSTMVFIDSSFIIRYTEYLDSALARTLRTID
jgi:hypothetical protein